MGTIPQPETGDRTSHGQSRGPAGAAWSQQSHNSRGGGAARSHEQEAQALQGFIQQRIELFERYKQRETKAVRAIQHAPLHARHPKPQAGDLLHMQHLACSVMGNQTGMEQDDTSP